MTSPFHLNRRGVTFPYRVFPGSVVARLLVPRSRHDLDVGKTPGPPGISLATRAQRRDSLDNPLLGLGPPSRLDPTSLPTASRSRAPLMGFHAPSAHKVERVHVRPVSRSALPVARESTSRFHPAGYGVAHRLSQPLGDLLPLSAALPFSDRWRSWGSALQGILPSTMPRRLVIVGLPS